MTSLFPPVREKLTRFGSISVFAVRSFIPFRLLRLQKFADQMTLQPFALLTIWTRTSNTQLKTHTELTASMHCTEMGDLYCFLRPFYSNKLLNKTFRFIHKKIEMNLQTVLSVH